MVTIGVEQLLSIRALDEHQRLEKIKKLYRYDGRCDDQQQYIAILEAAMLSTTEGNTNKSPMSMIISVPVNNYGAKNHNIS